MRDPKVAYFPDSFHEVNGVAHTSRNFEAYAGRRSLEFLCVRAGPRKTAVEQAGTVRTLELGRSRWSLRVEKDLEFDLLFWRHAGAIERELRRFRPEVIHITGPSELGWFGAYFAWKLGVPLVASWHTNVHEYLARRTGRFEDVIERTTLWAMMRFYGLARALFAPNAELCAMLETGTGRACHLMRRGVDTALFTPGRRTRSLEEPVLRLGYVGRLSVEKNIALLPRLTAELRAMGVAAEFFIIGQGGEEATLQRELPGATFAGVLRGEALAAAYAEMDVLVFPSHTDTFGNVVLEALASGVPAVVTPDGGPKFIVRDGETGFVVEDKGFVGAVASLARDREMLGRFRGAARAYALGCSWDAVFGKVVGVYAEVVAGWRAEIAGVQGDADSLRE